jgi:drug/metabolite transporter (DMT)-like permease
LTQGGQFLTLKYLDAIPFSLLLNFTAVVVAVVGIVLLREVPSRLQWAGIVIFIVGTAIYFFPISIPSGSIIGFVIAGFTVCANAAASLLGRSINRQKTISPLVVTVISMGIGAAVLLAIGVAVEGLPSLSVNNWGVIIWLAVVNTAFAFTLWNKTLQTLTAVESSIINNTMLIQIAILAWLFLGEQLSTQDVFGLALASIGILLVNIRPSKKPQAD